MKSTLKQSRSGSLALALLLGLSAAALPAQAQTAGKKARAAKAAATQNAPASSSRSGDYIVAIVNSEPVTNHEVNRRAGMLAQQLRANKVAVPDRATLLRRALNDEILQKAATFSARNSGMTVGDEELRQIEANLARDRKMSVDEFRKRIIAERGITASQYRQSLLDQSLLDQILLERVRDARINAEVARISDVEALQLLRDEQRKTGATLMAEQSHARHILLRPAPNLSEQQALARLAAVRASIASGKTDFASAARELSQDGSASAGGDLGWAPAGQFVPEFEQQLDRLKPGQMSQPFMSRFGAHLVQLIERRTEPMNEAQQIAVARAALRERKAAQALQQWENEIRNRAYIEMRAEPR